MVQPSRNVHKIMKMFLNFIKCSEISEYVAKFDNIMVFQRNFVNFKRSMDFKKIMFPKKLQIQNTMFEFQKLFGISKNVPVLKNCSRFSENVFSI